VTDVVVYDDHGQDERLKTHETFAPFLVASLEKASIVASLMTNVEEAGVWREQRRIFFLHPTFTGCRKVASSTSVSSNENN
jgi:hypothetical protein